MLKKQVIEQLQSLLENSEDSRSEEGDIWDKDIEALKIAIKAVETFESEESTRIAVILKAKRSPENANTFYYELETGERLVINTDYKIDLEDEYCSFPVGQLEGIYNPNEKEKDYERAFKRLVREIDCKNCPSRFSCAAKELSIIPHEVCEKNIYEDMTE